MSFEDKITAGLYKAAKRTNNIGKNRLSDVELWKHTKTSYAVGKFFFIVFEGLALSWLFLIKIPEVKTIYHSIVSVLLMILITLWFRK